MFRDLTGPNRPPVIEWLIQHQHEIVVLKQSNGCRRSLYDRCDIFVKYFVHDATNFTKCPTPVAQFPKHAVHCIEWPPYFPRSTQKRRHPSFDATKLFRDSKNNFLTAHAAQRRIFFHHTNACPPNRCSAWVLFKKRMIFYSG